MNTAPTPPFHDPLAAARSGSPPPDPLPDDLAQHLPDLEVLELIGRGGMGRVYRVRRRSDAATFALKVVQAEPGREAAFRERFAREAEALTRLRHPNIAAIHGHGETGSWCWLLMDLIDGANLREVLATGALSAAQTLALVAPLCAALQYAHNQGVVHRDLKPENILLDTAGVPHIVDFGLAKLHDPAGAQSLTRSGTAMGTMHYMAPEQVANAKEVDHRADIYGLGVVLYELLTGQLPLGRFEPPSQRIQIDVRIDDVVLKALERDPERRWQQVQQFGEAMAKADDRRRDAANGIGSWSTSAKQALALVAGSALSFWILVMTGAGRAQYSLLLVLVALVAMGMFIARLNRRRRLLAIGVIVFIFLAGMLAFLAIPTIDGAQSVTTALLSPEQIQARAHERQRLQRVLVHELADPAYAGHSSVGPDPVQFAPEIGVLQRVEVLLRLHEPFAMAVVNTPTPEVLAHICRGTGMTCLIPAGTVIRPATMTFHFEEGPRSEALRMVAERAGLRLTYGPVTDVITVSGH